MQRKVLVATCVVILISVSGATFVVRRSSQQQKREQENIVDLADTTKTPSRDDELESTDNNKQPNQKEDNPPKAKSREQTQQIKNEKKTIKTEFKNPLEYGWAAWYVIEKRAELGLYVPLPPNSSHVYYCPYIMQNDKNLKKLDAPVQGAIVCIQGSSFWHSAIVEQVNSDGTFWVSEMNAAGQRSIKDTTPTGGWGIIDYRKLTSNTTTKFLN